MRYLAANERDKFDLRHAIHHVNYVSSIHYFWHDFNDKMQKIHTAGRVEVTLQRCNHDQLIKNRSHENTHVYVIKKQHMKKTRVITQEVWLILSSTTR
jgi:hypothetical protein